MAIVTLFCDWDERWTCVRGSEPSTETDHTSAMAFSNPVYPVQAGSTRWRIDFDTAPHSQHAQVRRATEDEIAGRADPEPLCVPDEQLVLTHVQSLLLEERPWEERARDVLAYVTERLTRPG